VSDSSVLHVAGSVVAEYTEETGLTTATEARISGLEQELQEERVARLQAESKIAKQKEKIAKQKEELKELRAYKEQHEQRNSSVLHVAGLDD